jgi:hypothetical protein
MKKWIIGSLILVALVVVAAGVYGQTSDKEKKMAKHECKFVDQNNDGKCDKCGTTADKCKNESKMTEAKDCSKCPSASTCAEQKDAVTTAGESSAASTCAEHKNSANSACQGASDAATRPCCAKK